MSTRLNLDQCG